MATTDKSPAPSRTILSVGQPRRDGHVFVALDCGHIAGRKAGTRPYLPGGQCLCYLCASDEPWDAQTR